MTQISIYFFGAPGGPHDKAATAIFEAAGARHIGSGTTLVGPAAGERDICYEVPDDCADEVKRKLKAVGFRFTPSEGSLAP